MVIDLDILLSIIATNARCRCGMVYYDVGDLGWRPYVKSWMQRVGQKYKEETRVRILLFVSCECPEGYLVTPLRGLLNNSIKEGLLVVWGLGYKNGWQLGCYDEC